MARPQPGDYGNFYQGYIDHVVGEDVLVALEGSIQPLQKWLDSLDGKDLSYSYAEGKWTIAQLLQHMIDTERVFAYRAMCIGRGEKQMLPGFDENEYAFAAPAASRKLKGLAEELITLRKASIILFRSLAKETVLERRGMASGNPVTVKALGFLIIGHVLHHQRIIGMKYFDN
jgi:uncharacterized damage-inducible protein DinB